MGQAGLQGGASLEDHYFLQKVKLGEGSFGTVWRAVDRRTNDVVAIKQLDKASLPRRGVRRSDIEREVAMMQACEHANITRLFGTFEDDSKIYLALEYCDGGDFGDKVKERGLAIQEREVAEWMRQICSALVALHSKRVCHRDIKPDNFMVAGHGSNSQLKLSDFGLAVYLPRGKLLQEKCGTPAFMAPEQHGLPKRSPGYDYAADVWAAGVSMYMVMFGGRHPFLTDRGQLDNELLLHGNLDFREGGQQRFFGFDIGPTSLRFSEYARELCSKMVSPDKRVRVTAEDCLRSPWISQGQVQERTNKNERGYVGASGVPNCTGSAERQPSPVIADCATGGGRTDGVQQGQKLVSSASPSAQMLPGPGHVSGFVNDGVNNVGPGTFPVPRQAQKEVLRLSSKDGTRTVILPAGTKCRYNSDTHGGWVDCVIKRYNDDATYDLDLKYRAPVDKLAPTATCCAVSAWPAGTLVSYHSRKGPIDAIVILFNEHDKTYKLDVKENADVDRIRARQPQQTNLDKAAADEQISLAPTPQIIRGTPNTAGARDGGKVEGLLEGTKDTRDGSAEAPLNLRDCQDQLGRHGEGMYCMTTDHGLVRIQAISLDNTYTVVAVNSSAEQRPQVLEKQLKQLRAPNDRVHAWPPGTKVWYDSPSMATWVESEVKAFNPDSRRYNLDVRDDAAPDKVIPRF